MQVLYEDNHIIIVNKASSEIVQGDKTGDMPLSEMVKAYIKEKYAKPGAVFLGVVHRLDRPVSGVVVFARTSKALERLNAMFREGGRMSRIAQWSRRQNWYITLCVTNSRTNRMLTRRSVPVLNARCSAIVFLQA